MAIAQNAANAKGVSPSMNVTPLVDVVLVLLIIFMVVTPLLSKEFWLHLPKKDLTLPEAPMVKDNENVVLSVDERGAIRINQTEIPKAELQGRMQRVMAARTQKTLYLAAADKAPYDKVVEALDLSRLGGANHIAILTDPSIK